MAISSINKIFSVLHIIFLKLLLYISNIDLQGAPFLETCVSGSKSDKSQSNTKVLKSSFFESGFYLGLFLLATLFVLPSLTLLVNYVLLQIVKILQGILQCCLLLLLNLVFLDLLVLFRCVQNL